MVQYANPNSAIPSTTFSPGLKATPFTNWVLLTLRRSDGGLATMRGPVYLPPGRVTEDAVECFYADCVSREPSLKGAAMMDVRIYPYRLRRRSLLGVLADVWLRITYRPQPLSLPSEVWAVLGDEGLLGIGETMDLAAEMLYAAYAEDKDEDLESVKERLTLDLKLGDWCLAVQATGYRLRDWRITKVPAAWSER